MQLTRWKLVTGGAVLSVSPLVASPLPTMTVSTSAIDGAQ